MTKKRVIKKKPLLILLLIIILVLIGLIPVYKTIHGTSSKLSIKLNGKEKIELEVGNEYKEQGAKAKYDKTDITKDIKKTGKVNTTKIGEYKITYTIRYKKVNKKIIRKIKVIDKTAPEISLEGSDITVIVGNDYEEPGYTATDNYDGDITDKVTVNNTVDTSNVGEYTVEYSVEDSSKNKQSATRKVNVIARPRTDQKIAVLNYHFFYDPDAGEECNEDICERVSDFKAQLNWLRDNNYKTLTMKEFRDWMYGELELPDKSVLLTVDDGAMGTGTHNGNKLIPILEEYKMHATLFLITGWWPIDNYRSEYLDVESHTNNMHNGGMCSAYRGAQILCSSDEQVLEDLRTSISVTQSKMAFCFPFYAYSDHAIDLVKQSGFELAFIGGNTKTTRNVDKYHIPRYPIYKGTSLETFINYVS